MKELIDLSTKKLELLKTNGKEKEILELDLVFNRVYKEFLRKNEVNALKEINQTKYIDQLRQLKKIVTEIYSIESEKKEIQRKKNEMKKNKRIANSYKKYMK